MWLQSVPSSFEPNLSRRNLYAERSMWCGGAFGAGVSFGAAAVGGARAPLPSTAAAPSLWLPNGRELPSDLVVDEIESEPL